MLFTMYCTTTIFNSTISQEFLAKRKTANNKGAAATDTPQVNIILYFTILYYAILYYTLLCCTVLYCTALYYTILCYILYFTLPQCYVILLLCDGNQFFEKCPSSINISAKT